MQCSGLLHLLPAGNNLNGVVSKAAQFVPGVDNLARRMNGAPQPAAGLDEALRQLYPELETVAAATTARASRRGRCSWQSGPRTGRSPHGRSVGSSLMPLGERA